MANTYTQIHVQAVLAVQNRESLIHKPFQEDLYKYITGILQGEGHKMLQVNGMPDHVHLLFGFRPTQSLSDLMRIVNSKSSKWINENHIKKAKFSWQAGYGAFSYSKSQVPRVIEYIRDQELHHLNKSFIEEYEDLLKAMDIIYDPKYIFTQVMVEKIN